MNATSKLLAVWLIFGLGLPSPALALRATGLEESNQRPALAHALGVADRDVGWVKGWYALRGTWGPTRQLLRRFEKDDPRRAAIRAELIRFAKWFTLHHRMNPRDVLRIGLPVVNELSTDPATIPRNLIALEWLATRLAEQGVYPSAYESPTGEAYALWPSVGATHAIPKRVMRTGSSLTKLPSGREAPTIVLDRGGVALLLTTAIRCYAKDADFEIALKDSLYWQNAPNTLEALNASFKDRWGHKQSFFLYMSKTSTLPVLAGPQVAARAKTDLAAILTRGRLEPSVNTDLWLNRLADTVRALQARHRADRRDLYEAVATALGDAKVPVSPNEASTLFDHILEDLAVLRPASTSPVPGVQTLLSPLPSTQAALPPISTDQSAENQSGRLPDRQREAGLEEDHPDAGAPMLKPEDVRILWVDDDSGPLDLWLKLLRVFLPKSGHALVARIGPEQIHKARTVEDAIAQIKTRPPHLLILDLNLPDGLGFEVADAAKAADPSTIVIMVAAPYSRSQWAQVQKYLEAGTITQFLNKPSFQMRELVTAIEQHLGPRLTAGLEEEPIAAALERDGLAAVDVAADGTARLNDQVITIPELTQPGFFQPGSRTIMVRLSDPAVPRHTVLFDQVGIPGAPETLGNEFLHTPYRDWTRVAAPESLRTELQEQAADDHPVIVARTSWLPLTSAEELHRRRAQSTFIGMPAEYPVNPRYLAALVCAAQAQRGILYYSRALAVTYRNDRVLLIAA